MTLTTLRSAAPGRRTQAPGSTQHGHEAQFTSALRYWSHAACARRDCPLKAGSPAVVDVAAAVLLHEQLDRGSDANHSRRWG